MRHVQKCISNVLTTRDDFSLIVLADRRYRTKSYTDYLPGWMRDQLSVHNSDLSTDLIMQQAIGFYKTMAQPANETECIMEIL